MAVIWKREVSDEHEAGRAGAPVGAVMNMGASNYGYAVIDGRWHPISGIRMIDGGFEIQAHIYGPERAHEGVVTFFGADRVGVTQPETVVPIPDIAFGVRVVVSITFKIDSFLPARKDE